MSSWQYVLVCDKRWGFPELPTMADPHFRAIWNTGRRCYVDAVNLGAQYATGDVLIVIADDQYPAQDWDFRLAEVLADSGKEVVEVSTGTPAEHERGILVMPILTRARFERIGYVFFPSYESAFADNDFCEAARRDDAIGDGRHLLFPHRHPFFDQSVSTDVAYEAQNRPEAYALGGAVLQARRAANFGETMRKKKIAVLIPGESFSSQWVTNFMAMLGWLGQFFDYECHNAYCSNVYVARVGLARVGVASDADYLLWIDDDNIVTGENVKQLLIDLEGTPEIDAVSGWCGCHSNVQAPGKVQTSVGFFGENDKIEGVDPVELAAAQGLVKIDWTGFPLVLMRRESLARLTDPFMPIINPHNPYGFDSEDIAFSKRCREAGLKLACDPRVKVPHLKLRDADQISAPAGELQSKEKH